MGYRWHIFIANLDPIIGSEQGKTRPVLVISEEEINQILPVVNVLPITSRKPGRRIYPNEVLIPAEIGGLYKESIVLCYQIRTLDKRRMIREIGEIRDLEAKSEGNARAEDVSKHSAVSRGEIAECSCEVVGRVGWVILFQSLFGIGPPCINSTANDIRNKSLHIR